MSSRGLYRLDDGTFVRTQSEIPKGQTPNKVEVPIGSQELCDYLNAIILNERANRTVDSHVEQAPFDQSNLGTGSPETPEEVYVAPPPPVPNTHAEQLLAFEDEWENFPLARKAHFAALFCDEARSKIQ